MRNIIQDVKELLEEIEKLEWSVEEEGEHEYRLGKYSPAGQDFSISIEGETVEDLIDSIHDNYESFDVSENAYLWLDNSGHGKNGAPYHMKDVLEDMEACETSILDLYDALVKINRM